MLTKKNEKFSVNGVAIKAGVSKNNIKYLPEELEKFAPTLAGRPILKDHFSVTDNTIGLVENSQYLSEAVAYSGWIKDSPTEERIKDSRIKEVSIGAMAGKLVQEDEDDPESPLIARDIEAMELSTTPTPGIVGTSISQCLKQLENSKPEERTKIKGILENVKQFEKKDHEIIEDKGDEMAEEEQKEEPEAKEEPQEESEEPKEESFKPLVDEIKKLSERLDIQNKLEEKMAALEKKLEEKEKTKGNTIEEAEPLKYKLIKEDNAFRPGTRNFYAENPEY